MPRTYEPAKADTWSVDMQGGGHFDQTYATLTADCAAIRVFIFLTKVKQRGGAFLYAPGSHLVYREIMQRGPTTHPWRAGAWVRTRAGDPGYSPIPLEELLAEPGDVLLYHIHLGHSGSDNVSDRQTRHALTTSYAPERRIDPGDKPLDQMSTMEKACSIRWLHATHGDRFPTYPVSDGVDAERAFAEGFGVGVSANAETRFGGRQHRWYVTEDERTLIHHAISTDWVHWSDAGSFTVPGSVRSLHHRALVDDVYLTVATPEGTTIFSTDDYESWREVARIEGVSATCLLETDEDSGQRGLHLFAIDPSDPVSILRSTAGGRGRDLDQWSEPVTVARAPGPVDDVFAFPTDAEPGFAMVLHVRDHGLWCIRNDDGAAYEGEPVSLATDAPSDPHGIRVYEQAHRYWLCTYRRDGRLFWGSVDWDDERPLLRELSTPRAFQRALEIVGLA
jgi:hypothetical protein